MAAGNGSITLALVLCLLNFFQRTAGSTLVTTANLPLPTASEGLNCSQTVEGSNVSQCYFTLKNVPECARDCIKNVTLMTPCESTDIRCLCAHSESIQENGVQCMQGACDAADMQTTINYYFRLCKSANFPLSEDPSSSTSTLSSSIAAATVYTTATPTTNPIATSSSQKQKGSPSLSTAVKAGIGIGATLGGLVTVLSLGLYLVRRRDIRRRAKQRRDLDVLETVQFKPQRHLGRGADKHGTLPYHKGPIELPSEPAPYRMQEPGDSFETVILPRSPSDKDNFF